MSMNVTCSGIVLGQHQIGEQVNLIITRWRFVHLLDDLRVSFCTRILNTFFSRDFECSFFR